MKNSFLRGIVFSLGVLTVIGLASFATTYTPPPDKTSTSSLTHTDWNGLKNGIARWANGGIGGSNMSASDPIPSSVLDFDQNNNGLADDSYSVDDADISSISVSS